MPPIDRRRFLKLTGAAALASCTPARRAPPAVAVTGSPDVAVIGAGAFGGWTALNLRRLGASVAVIDQHGPGNSRATSGGETRGVRSSYGDRETWIRWANDALRRWRAWDEEWSERLNLQLFFHTGDLILRPERSNWLDDTLAHWTRQSVPHEILSLDEVAYRYPHVSVEGIELAVLELDAGVVRARRACEAVGRVFQGMGGRVVIARAEPGRNAGRRLLDVALTPDARLSADQYVFACGPWLPKVFPQLMGKRLRTPMGHVYYYGTPPGDTRWIYPNMPSYNVPGITGWPALPPDYRGFRVRTGGRPPGDPDETPRYIEPEFLERPRAFLAERFPLLKDAPLLETRACHYESSIDRNFIVDRHPEFDNVWIAGGGSAEGFKFGPVVGEYVARRVLNEPTDLELTEQFRLKDEEFEEEEPEPE